jgi:hypothetical protein
MRQCLFVLAGFAAVALAGCGAAKGTVSGQVKYKGQPLPWGDIAFLCAGGDKPVLHAKIQDGSYTVSGLPAGPAQVIVTTTPPPAPIKLPPGVKPIQTTEGTNTDSTPPGKYVPLPPRYSRPDQSGLTCPVKGGRQEYDVELTP